MKTTLATLCFAGILLLVISVGGCGKGSSNPYGMTGPAPAPSGAPPNTVMLANMAFSPATITVAKNTTITWTNNDGVAHTSTSDSGVWDTGNIAPGASKTTTFTSAGTYAFHCTYHSMMTGTVVVQ